VLFEIEISGEPGAYQVEVLHSEGGGRPRERLVLDPASILSHRTELENAVLASSVQSRRVIRQEGVLALVGPDGGADLIEAARLRDLLCEAEPTPRLVVLNSCSSGEAGVGDLFSGTAAALVQRGISAVAAMQFSITDGAAIRFARGFYTAIAHGRPVDEAVRSGRVGILGSARTLEWITPVLYVKTDSSQLFRLPGMPTPQLGAGSAGPAPQPDLPAGAMPAAAPAVTTVTAADTGTALDTETAPGTGIAADTGVAADPGTAADGRRTARTGEKTPGRPRPGPRPRRRRRWLLAAAAVTAAAAVIIGIVVTAGSDGSSGSPSGWPYSTGFSVYTRPYLVNGTIYVGNTSGHVYALNASTGAFRWRYPRGRAIGAVYSRPGVADHMVYVGSDNGFIYAIRARDGAAVWSSRCDENGDAVRSSPVFVDGVIYASTRGGSVCALKADDGSRFWDRPVLLGTTVPASSPEVSRHLPGSPPSQVLLYLGSDNGHVYALAGRTGKIQWQFPRSGQPGLGALAAQPAISSDGSVVYAGSNDGHLYALDADTGRLDWKYPATAQGLDGAIGAQPAVAAFSTTVYFASGFGVYAITGRGGQPSLTWKTDPVKLASNTGQSGPVATAGDVYVGSGKHVVCLDAGNGSLCWHPPFTADSRVVTTPVVGNGVDTIYVGTLDGNVYALTPGGRVLRAR